MRVELKGVHTTSKRLADGTTRRYYYAWAGGPRLAGEPGSPEFVRSYQEAYTARKELPRAAFFSIIAQYRHSTAFTTLASSTRKDYGRHLKAIEEEFGDLPIKALDDIRTRGVFKEWRDEMADTPRTADLAWTVLARVLAWAKDAGKISTNVCERGGRLYESERVDIIWSEDQVNRALAGLPPHLLHPFVLALWTGQRQGDILRLAWTNYDGERIRLRQGKTKAKVSIRAGAPLKAMLDTMPRLSTQICLSTDKRPWTSDGFRASWRRAVGELGITGVTFHDLRGTAITRLAEAGCSVGEIAAISGHSLATVNTVLEAYLSRTEALADAGIAKLERADQERKLQTGSKPVGISPDQK